MAEEKKIFIGIPVLNRIDLLEECLDTIDHPADIVVINNNTVDRGINDHIIKLRTERGIYVRHARFNLGVAASWNQLIMMGMGWGYDTVFIGSNDTRLNPGSLAATVKAIEEDEEGVGIWHLAAWNFWAIQLDAVRKVGLFDENFYPAYREDQDYSYRCSLAGVPRKDVPGAGGDHKGSQTIHSDPDYGKKNHDTHNNWNTCHYRMKWGGLALHETHKTPYNRDDVDHKWWPDPDGSISHRDWDKDKERIR